LEGVGSKDWCDRFQRALCAIASGTGVATKEQKPPSAKVNSTAMLASYLVFDELHLRSWVGMFHCPDGARAN